MDKRLEDLREELASGSTTFHLGNGTGPGPLSRFLGRARAPALAVGAVLAVAAATQFAPAPGDAPPAVAHATAEQAADALREDAVRDFVANLNARMDRKIALAVDVSTDRGEQVRTMVVGEGADVTVCASGIVTGTTKERELFPDRDIDWRTDPAAARVALQFELASSVAWCLARAGIVAGQGVAGAVAKVDSQVEFGHVTAVRTMLEAIGTGGLDGSKATRDSSVRLAMEHGDVTHGRLAAVIQDVIRMGPEVASVSSYGDVGRLSATVAFDRMGFAMGAKPGSARAPDGSEVGVVPGEADFGWTQVAEIDGDMPAWDRRFADPELDASVAKVEADAVAELEMEEVPDAHDPAHLAEGGIVRAAAAQRDAEYAEEGILYRGTNRDGEECREALAGGPSGGTSVLAACKGEDGSFSIITQNDFIRVEVQSVDPSKADSPVFDRGEDLPRPGKGGERRADSGAPGVIVEAVPPMVVGVRQEDVRVEVARDVPVASAMATADALEARRGEDGAWRVVQSVGPSAGAIQVSAAEGGKGFVARGDVGFGAAEVLISKDGTNVFKDAAGHTVAMVGGPRNLRVGFAQEDGRTVKFDLDEGYRAEAPRGPGR